VAAFGGTLPFAQGDTLRPRLRTLGLLGVLAAFRCVLVPFLPPLASTAIFAVAGIAWLALLDRADTDPPGLLLDGFGEAPSGLCDWVDGALLPGGFLAVLLVSLEGSPAGGAVWVLGRVTLRPAYQYVPFATRESAAAAAIAVAWVVAIRLTRRSHARAGAFGFVFLWFHQELAFAVGPSASTLLLVTYYAVCGVASLGLGRAREL